MIRAAVEWSWSAPRWRPLRLVGGALVLVALLGVVPVRFHLHNRPAVGAEFRYRFQRPERGSVLRALQAEAAFYQERIARYPRVGLDRAALAGTYLRIARATGDLRWYLLAEQAAQESLAYLHINNAGAWLALARVAEAKHDFGEAIRLAHLAGLSGESLSTIITSNLARGAIHEARRDVEVLVAHSPGLNGYALRALVDIAEGNDAAADTDFRRAVALEEIDETGSSVWVRTLYGRWHYQRGRLTTARALYDEALRILPQYPLALVNLAELEIRVGALSAAERHLHSTVTITAASPNIYDHVVLRGLARLNELRGDARAATHYWNEAEARLRRDVTSGQFGHRRELARLLLTRARPGDLPEALALMHQEIAVRRDADTLDTLAWALSRAGRWHQAQQAVYEALGRGVRDARLFYRAATIEQALGRSELAAMLYRSALLVDPTFDANARQALAAGL